MNEKFNFQKQYELYLEHSGLSEEKMIEAQKRETKRAFAGGFIQALIILEPDNTILPGEEAKGILYLRQQIHAFFINEQ